MSSNHEDQNTIPIVADNHQFLVEGHNESLYAGAVHYWRLERDKWGEILDKVKSLGFTAISIYMPWEVHEIERGQFDFGSIDPNKDLDAFASCVKTSSLLPSLRSRICSMNSPTKPNVCWRFCEQSTMSVIHTPKAIS